MFQDSMMQWKLPTISTELKPDSPEFSRPQPPRASTTEHMSPLFSSNIFIHHRYQVKQVPILSQFSSPCGQFAFSLELPLQGGLLQILTRSRSTWISMAFVCLVSVITWYRILLHVASKSEKGENIKMGSYLALTFRPRTPLSPSSCDNQVFQIKVFPRLQLFYRDSTSWQWCWPSSAGEDGDKKKKNKSNGDEGRDDHRPLVLNQPPFQGMRDLWVYVRKHTEACLRKRSFY